MKTKTGRELHLDLHTTPLGRTIVRVSLQGPAGPITAMLPHEIPASGIVYCGDTRGLPKGMHSLGLDLVAPELADLRQRAAVLQADADAQNAATRQAKYADLQARLAPTPTPGTGPAPDDVARLLDEAKKMHADASRFDGPEEDGLSEHAHRAADRVAGEAQVLCTHPVIETRFERGHTGDARRKITRVSTCEVCGRRWTAIAEEDLSSDAIWR